MLSRDTELQLHLHSTTQNATSWGLNTLEAASRNSQLSRSKLRMSRAGRSRASCSRDARSGPKSSTASPRSSHAQPIQRPGAKSDERHLRKIERDHHEREVGWPLAHWPTVVRDGGLDELRPFSGEEEWLEHAEHAEAAQVCARLGALKSNSLPVRTLHNTRLDHLAIERREESEHESHVRRFLALVAQGDFAEPQAARIGLLIFDRRGGSAHVCAGEVEQCLCVGRCRRLGSQLRGSEHPGHILGVPRWLQAPRKERWDPAKRFGQFADWSGHRRHGILRTEDWLWDGGTFGVGRVRRHAAIYRQQAASWCTSQPASRCATHGSLLAEVRLLRPPARLRRGGPRSTAARPQPRRLPAAVLVAAGLPRHNPPPGAGGLPGVHAVRRQRARVAALRRGVVRLHACELAQDGGTQPRRKQGRYGRPEPPRLASAAQAADWPRLAEASGSLSHDLALRDASGAPAGRGLSRLVLDIGAQARQEPWHSQA
eukprot:scaffold4414_cov65-Phaeocystis_antarctica.AAC.8